MRTRLNFILLSLFSTTAVTSAAAQVTDHGAAIDLAQYCAEAGEDGEASCARMERLADDGRLSLFDTADLRGLLPADILNGRTLLRVVFPGRTFFGFDSTSLSAEGEAAVDTIAEELETDGDTLLIIAGHADSRGPAPYNKTLSDRRADAAAAALRGRGATGVDIRTIGFGETAPLFPNAVGSQHGFNRRVEFIFAAAGAGAAGALIAATPEEVAAVSTETVDAMETSDADGAADAAGADDAAKAAAAGGLLGGLLKPRIEATYTYFELDEPEFHAAGGRLGLDIGKYAGIEGEYHLPVDDDPTTTQTGIFDGVERQIIDTDLRSQWGAYGVANFPLPRGLVAFARAGYSEIRFTRHFLVDVGGDDYTPPMDTYELVAATMADGGGSPAFPVENFETTIDGGFAFGGGLRGKFVGPVGWRADYTRIDLEEDVTDAWSVALTLNF
ncbi:MAG: OmpA family protein [Pseudomonadota bacterium]